MALDLLSTIRGFFGAGQPLASPVPTPDYTPVVSSKFVSPEGSGPTGFIHRSDPIKTTPSKKTAPPAPAVRASSQTGQVKGASTTKTARPTPTLIPGVNHQYLDILRQYFQPQDVNRASNVSFGESSQNPMAYNVNPGGGGSLKSPSDLAGIINRGRQGRGSVDIGLMQLNTGTNRDAAMENYLRAQGLTWEDLLDPSINARVAADLLYGKIPYKAPGWGNWYAPQAR